MTAVAYACAGGGSALVTTIELLFRNQRLPVGDFKMKAVGWWLVVTVIDVLIACVGLFGLVKLGVVDSATEKIDQAWLLGFVAGILGPLALRSPIRESKVDERESLVGMTYIYDAARLRAMYALDDRLLRLRRQDVSKVKEKLKAKGMTVEVLITKTREHVEEHPALTEDRKDDIRSKIALIETVRDDDKQFDGVVKLLREVRFNGLLDEVLNQPLVTTSEEIEVIDKGVVHRRLNLK
jgi:hypothetical protein